MDSNHQHSRCKRDALPIELITLNFGIKGFEPLNARTKNESLTTWLYPNKFDFIVKLKIILTFPR